MASVALRVLIVAMLLAISRTAVREDARFEVVSAAAVDNQSFKLVHAGLVVLELRQDELLPLCCEALVDLVSDNRTPSVVTVLHMAFNRVAELCESTEKPLVNADVLGLEPQLLVVSAEL